MDADIDACVRDEYARLVGVTSIVTGSDALAEEAVQEAFALAMEHRRRGQHIEHLPAWVVTVALNRARSGRRREGSEQRALQRLAARPTGSPLSEPEVGIVVRSALAVLPARQKEAVVLYYFLDMSVAEVAAALGTSEGTVKSALSRARHTLAILLDEREGAPHA